MSDDVPERTYGAGEDIPGTPGPFPFGPASFGLAMAAAAFRLVPMLLGASDGFPAILDQPIFYWAAMLGCFICSGLAVRQRRGGWAAISTFVAIVTLTPIYPLAIVLLLSAMD